MNIHFYDSTQLAYAKITVCSDYDDHEDTWTWLAKALRVKQFYVLIDRFDFALKSLHDKDNYDWFFRRRNEFYLFSCFFNLQFCVTGCLSFFKMYRTHKKIVNAVFHHAIL